MTNEVKVQSEAKVNLIKEYEKLADSRDKYQEQLMAADGRATDMEINAQQLKALLIAIDWQLGEVEGIYNIIKTEVIKSGVKEDRMEKNLKHLRSLIEIARDHNGNNIEA